MCAVCTLSIVFLEPRTSWTRRGECPQSLFYFVPQEISQPSILGSRERRVPIFVLIRKPSTAFVDQQFDSLCFMPCSQSMRHCFIIHASRGCHNACTTSHNTTIPRIPQCLHNIRCNEQCTSYTALAQSSTH